MIALRRTLPSVVGKRPLRAGWVLAGQFDPSCATIALEPVSKGRAALLLLDNAVAARIEPVRVMAAIRATLVDAGGAVMRRGEADVAARRLLPLLGEPGMVVPEREGRDDQDD